ncbi:cation:proton antiporter [Kibdelosporangium persicum]|uniref:Integral membrane ion antiporter n=1 Tax=Kibdelosporangium persicum TaxID=2698649 RepID=A0ABX2FIB6_9PSEU|nr:cation:proton antiporter [Kibdelosporangium persicum]NRN70859.1 Integral membrane ion antiporter [Kibdelosporangium persicum]
MLAAAPVPPMSAHSLMLFLLQLGLLLLLALVLGKLAGLCKMPAVVGELCAGVILGPSLLTQIAPGFSHWLLPADSEQFHLLDGVGQLGVLLLVGVTGAHLDLALVRKRVGTVTKISAFGLVIPLGFGVAAGLLLPAMLVGENNNRTVFALFLGVAMCVSAIPVIAKTLFDMNLLHRNVGQLTLAAGMVDDVFGWFMLSVVSAMATTGLRTSNVLLSIACIAGVVLVAALSRPLVRRIFKLAGRTAAPGPTIATFVVLILLAAAGTHALALEAVFGAFVCGILINRYGKPDPAKLAPLRTFVLGVLAPIFFATAGLRMDLTALAEPPVLLAGLAVLAIAVLGKFAGAYLGARTSRLTRWEALALGAGMNARGVIEVIVAMVGLRLGVLNTEMYTIIVLVAVVTSLMAPPILRVAMKRVEYTAEEEIRRNANLPPALDGRVRDN